MVVLVSMRVSMPRQLATGPHVLQVARPEALHLLETVWGTQGCGCTARPYLAAV